MRWRQMYMAQRVAYPEFIGRFSKKKTFQNNHQFGGKFSTKNQLT